MNVRASHSESLHLFKTPNFTSRSISCFKKCHDDSLALEKLLHDMSQHLPSSLTLLLMFQSFLRFHRINVHTSLTDLKYYFSQCNQSLKYIL
jgi:hypothetical protein